MRVREVVHRFTLDEDRYVPVHDAEVSKMTVLNGVALVVGREKELLVEGDATERQFDSQCVLVHVLVEEGSEVFVHLLARSQGWVDELFVYGFVCVCHSIWVENYINYKFLQSMTLSFRSLPSIFSFMNVIPTEITESKQLTFVTDCKNAIILIIVCSFFSFGVMFTEGFTEGFTDMFTERFTDSPFSKFLQSLLLLV